MKLILLCCLLSILIKNTYGELTQDDDRYLKSYVEYCLAEIGLNISILGITKIDDLRDNSFENLKFLEEEKRNCFVACILQKRGIITSNGTLREHLPSPEPAIKSKTNYENAINTCRGEKNICRLGGCFYKIYF